MFFLESIKERARIYSWKDILTVADAQGNKYYIPDAYGMYDDSKLVRGSAYMGLPKQRNAVSVS
jgi:hypothetical protein